MSIFICNECSEQVDSDFEKCFEDPSDDKELICESCYREYLDAIEIEYLDARRYRNGKKELNDA